MVGAQSSTQPVARIHIRDPRQQEDSHGTRWDGLRAAAANLHGALFLGPPVFPAGLTSALATDSDRGVRPNFEFTYRLNNRDCQFVMTSVLGHVMETDFSNDFRKWASCDPLDLFDAPVVRRIQDKLKDVQQNIAQEARRASRLMIWTDCDREGENIGAEIAEVCRAANPRIDVNPVDLNWREAEAVDARIELDLRIGAAFTRFQTLTFQRRFRELKDRIISYGSCQFPTLGFVVDQFLKAESFVPEAFWKI
ncbi:MAG: DNA topoisomerase, partial [Olpidium bornovanus]